MSRKPPFPRGPCFLVVCEFEQPTRLVVFAESPDDRERLFWWMETQPDVSEL